MLIGYAILNDEVMNANNAHNNTYDAWKAAHEASGHTILELEKVGSDWGNPRALNHDNGDVTVKTDEERFRTSLDEQARAIANFKRDQDSQADIDHVLDSEESGTFKLTGLSQMDVMFSTIAPQMFPQTWKCENGDKTVTLNDMQTLQIAIASRRQTAVYSYQSIKDSFVAMTITELRAWITANEA